MMPTGLSICTALCDKKDRTIGSNFELGEKELTSTQNSWKPRIIDSLVVSIVPLVWYIYGSSRVDVPRQLLDELTVHLIPHLFRGNSQLDHPPNLLQDPNLVRTVPSGSRRSRNIHNPFPLPHDMLDNLECSHCVLCRVGDDENRSGDS